MYVILDITTIPGHHNYEIVRCLSVDHLTDAQKLLVVASYSSLLEAMKAVDEWLTENDVSEVLVKSLRSS